MKLMRIISTLTIIVLLELAVGAVVLRSKPEVKLDTLAVNELLHSIKAQWKQLLYTKTLDAPTLNTPLDYAILKNDGTLLTVTNPNVTKTLNEAISHRDTIVDLVLHGQTVGKIIIYNNTLEQLFHLKKQTFTNFLLFTLLSFSLLLGYLFYLNRTVFHPFHKLKEFAVRVAGGNLDLPLTMDKNNTFGAFTESFDLMRSELQKARKLERSATQSKKELVAKLSHDIKTPVSSIRAVAELMTVSARTEKEQIQLAIIQNKADQVDQLITDLFHATLEELHELTVTPDEYLSSTLLDLISAADYQKRTIVEDIPECALYFDKIRLQQVFDNIIINSYKYADTNISITFSLVKDILHIQIKDNGNGITMEELPLVFHKYYRGSNAINKSGVGLGLFISQYFITQMGGYISCENLLDGFLVTVSLKLSS